ncbi:MAG: SDR family NAD(P)-dependent oxidoreductase [Thermoanaerobaculia bacterium]
MSELSTISRHGHWAKSLIDVCAERGLFHLLGGEEFRDRAWLAATLNANEGYFSIALEALVSLGRLEQRGETYRAGSGAREEGPFDASVPDEALASAHLRELLFGDHLTAMRELRESGSIQSSRADAARDVDVRDDLRQEIVAIFDCERNPDAVVDIHCGNGSVLAELFQSPPLADAPVHLIAADDDPRNLDAAAEALAGHCAHTLRCSFDDPEMLRPALELLGVSAEQEVLQLRRFIDSFLEVDADRPVRSDLAVLAADHPTGYVDRNGRGVDALTVLSCWQEHLRRLAKSAGRSRLLIAERHAAHWFDRLLQRYEITADAFITLAAGVGLFGDEPVRRHPRSSAPCDITLHCLTPRDYVVRHATEGDLERLEELETLCWHHTRTSREQIRARLQTYPQGQFVLEKDGRVLGVLYSQRIADVDGLTGITAADVHQLHDPSGAIVQLLAVNIDPAVQNAGYGDQLLEFMLQRCGVLTGVDRVVGVTLCKSYDAAACSIEEYIRRQGSSQDPVLAFHSAHGAEVVKAVPGYRPEDHANRHDGVLISYDILHRPRRRQRLRSDRAVHPASFDREQIARFVRTEAARLLGIGGGEVDVDRPVMEMGLDSADLLKLQRLCEEEFGLQLHTGFFFENSSIRRVVDSLTGKLVVTSLTAPLETSVSRTATAAPTHDADGIADTDIAVIGMACRLPGGIETPDQLWRVLASSECVVGTYPAARGAWPAATEYPGIDQGGFVKDADAFDAAFFRISPAEAQITDPQQRMLLELAWSCLEDAGVLPATLRGSKAGVFVGASNCDYSRLVQEAGLEIEAHNGVGSSLAILANRISYFFDLSGPSLVVDTACSSSLVALHTAVHSLRSGECATAFVGGVNLICHPDLSVAYHKAGMLAPDGRCKVFDVRANGYVRSEGAVVLLLKPLRDAIAEQNRVHAVIRGSATNHGGLSGGLTVPNPQKQKELLMAAWKDAAITARDLSYIEAHGTGTSLGDPIEIQGIQAAYAAHGPADPATSCAVGSVKSNLGHLESAAGITGLLKVILSLRHRQLPASVHFSELNPKIRLQDTPFVIQDRLRAWDASRPRVAAISSFGSGGANAHVVVQEYAIHRAGSGETGDVLFVLSAGSETRLRVYASRVVQWLEQEGATANFADAIFTWQTGRTAMKQRLAIRVKDRADLLGKLKQWLAGEPLHTGPADVAGLWTGHADRKDASLTHVWRTKTGQQLIDQALAAGDLDVLGAIWTAGVEIDWRRQYEAAPAGDAGPGVVSVPTYPFAKDRYWIDVTATKQRPGARASADVVPFVIHPLLHTNTSDLSQQSYSVTFSGEEFFLADHQVLVDGRTPQRVLPGVAYLEMAHAAIDHALPVRDESAVLELRNTAWVQPIVVTGKKQVRIALLAGDDAQIEYEVYSQDAEERVVHCQGRAVFTAKSAPVLDLPQLERQMVSRIEPERVYSALAGIGLVYGPAFQSITSIREGHEQNLAHVRLPQAVADISSGYTAHPSIMDGALQSAVWLIAGASPEAARARLPFAVESVRVFAPCSPDTVAWVRYAHGSKADDATVKLDIDLCDERGNVCVQMQGLSLRTAAARRSTAEVLLAAPVWRASDVGTFAAESVEHHVLLCERSRGEAEQIASFLPRSHCLSLQAAPAETIARRYSSHAIACFERVQSILAGRPGGNVLVQIVVTAEGEQALLAGLSGLLKTAAQENPRLVGQVILVPPGLTAEELGRVLREEKGGAPDPVVRYEQHSRQVLRWQEIEAATEAPMAFKDRGVYLITGGLGAVGRLFGREILEQTTDAHVVLTGRGELDAEKRALLDELSAGSGRVTYRRLDLTDLDQVRQAIVALKEEHGRLDGILHCAGMIADNFLLKKGVAELEAVLAPKVAGTVHLDEASRDLELDFFMLFSSFAGALGNVGQADYAAANAFMDQFSTWRNRLVATRQRHGRTRSIGWPLWEAGGMKMDAATQERLERSTGMQPMQTPSGLRAFHRSLALPYDHLLVMEGDLARMRIALMDPPPVPVERVAEPSRIDAEGIDAGIEAETFAEKTEEYLRKQLSGLLKLPWQAIDAEAPLEEYGIDSMLAMKLTNQLEETFGSLPKTLFFEVQTIRALRDHFLAQYASELTALFAPSIAPESRSKAVVSHRPAPAISTRRFSAPRAASTGAAAEPEPIAIIGLSGRYPGAIDVEAYWNNLRDGRDSIVEVPRERWDWREYFGEDRNGNGRHSSKWGGFIDGVDEFDPLFFNISPKDAKYIDPQERLFLQHAWMAVEDAGYTRAALQIPHERDLPGQVGVYVGVMWSEYQLFGTEANAEDLRMGFAGNLASIANRVSYALNLHGPSMTLDTMCSSSLTAIHVACQDLKLGRTSLAIAGGVNVSVHPHKYLVLSVGQFISGDGHCQSFGEGGDGYIPGEGVGVVVLKRLSEAERDGDHIYGVIRGSALTHGGKTNGYTVPNPQAQASAISRAMAEARIDARSISYVEAHGTGTKLGDPIEIAALSKAFDSPARDAQLCPIGSAKSNIGHCESAAGIAGLTKVLLQMRHLQIAPSLHSAQLNPHIDFARSPFVVNQTLRAWEPPVIDGRTLSRIAGISSFGAGGSNAHMIVEEHQAPAQVAIAVAEVAIPLSARTPEQLQQKARDLLDFVTARQESLDLPSVAYTLQVGREAMEERLGFVVSSVAELAEKLQAFVRGEEEIGNAYRGQVKRNREALSLFSSDPDLQQTVEKWIASGKMPKLLDLWVKGLELDWGKLYGQARPKRVSLPTYPFARERYWIDTARRTVEATAVDISASTATVLHPLLHTNASDLTEQRYHSTFAGHELFLVDGVLPASAQLEMIRAAIDHAMPERPDGSLLELRHVVWGEPVAVDGKRKVRVALWPGNNDTIEFEICTDENDREIVHCQGHAVFNRETAQAPVDLERVAAQLPSPPHPTESDYVLHPVLLDSALLAAAGRPRTPHAVESVRIVAPCPRGVSAWARRAGDFLDLDLRDEHGAVCMQLRGLRWQQTAPEHEPAIEDAAVVIAPKVFERRSVEFLPPAETVAVSLRTTESVERKKPARIALAAPSATVGSEVSPAAQRARITLTSAGDPGNGHRSATPVGSPVRLHDCGSGIFAIEVAASRAKDVLAHVLLALDSAQRDPSVRVLMISGIEHCFLRGGREELNEAVDRGLFRALMAFPYPVIAVLQGDIVGAGFLATALCDFMVCNQDAVYGFTDPQRRFCPTVAEGALFGKRFGAGRAQDFLYGGTPSTGRDLRAKGWTCPIVPFTEVEAHAERLASALATKSRKSLRLLKQHLTRDLSPLVDALASVAVVEDGRLETVDGATSRVRVVELDAPVSDLAAHLREAVAEAERSGDAIVLTTASDELAIRDVVLLDLGRVLVESEVPVVAALAGNARGNAWLLAQFCEAAVYSRQGVYATADTAHNPLLARMAVAFFTHRLGSAATPEILLTGADYSGAELGQRIGFTTIAEREDVVPTAMRLAKWWATAMPRAAWATSKKQTAAVLQEALRTPPAVTAPEQEDDSLAIPGSIPLQSTVVTATAHSDGIVVVRMQDRDAKNMFSDALMQGVREVFAHIAEMPAYKVVILTGYGHYFASGGTRESLLAIQEGRARFTDFDIYRLTLDCKLPVIAAMQGHGIGAGWSMGMFADIALLCEESRYVSPYMNYGFTPGAGATYSLPEKMGADLARESLLTAQQYAGRELKARGLALRVLPRAEVNMVAMTLARQMARAPRRGLIDLKAQLIAHMREPLDETFRRELAMHDETFVGQSETLAQIQKSFQQEAPAPAVAVQEPLVAAPVGDADALRAVTATLRALLAGELQMRESDVDDNAQFADLGLDSISGVTWIRRINEKYQTAIEATKVYSYPTLLQLSRYVKGEAEARGTLPAAGAATAEAKPVVPVPSTPLGAARTPRPVATLHASQKLTSRRSRGTARFAGSAPVNRPPEPIAVIGMAGQFPQARNLEEFWQNIADGRNCITAVPRQRWDVDAYYQPGDPSPGKTASRWAGALEDYDRFDPLFFNISPTEAESMDPQQRLFLQACWHSIENAGYAPRFLSGSRCGVFVGCTNSDYHQLSRQVQWSAQGFTGSALSILAARISYFLNLQGPCVSIDTACSSSLVSIAQACDSLTSGTSDLALAGGVYVMVGPGMHIKTSQAGMLSPDGRCFTFDERANGFVPGEGVGVVLLKRLSDAQRDHDIIHAVIHGWGVNQDGKTNGITAPNPESQTRLEQEVYEKFGIDPAEIQLVETHGTGTKLGDPIEVEGLKHAFRKHTRNTKTCALGSVKSNIGHCLSAAGVAGVLKLILALKHKQLPPTINFERLNEHIDLEDSPFYVNARLKEWESTARGRQAATSSFGFSGTNAHMVLGEYVPPVETGRPATLPVRGARAIVPLSAKTPEQLEQKARDLLEHIRRDAPSIDLIELSYTLQVGRDPMDERLGFLVASVDQLAVKLEAWLNGASPIDDVHRGRVMRSTDSTSIISQDEDVREAIVQKWIAEQKLGRLLELWVHGLDVDWNKLYGDVKPQRIPLPAYPFARERYWIEASDAQAGAMPAVKVLHPLLHSNTSDLAEQRYSTTFTGEEFFLSDHRIRTGERSAAKLLPGVAYLEMARAAIQQASPAQAEANALELRDTVWLKPVVVDGPREVSVALVAGDDGRLEYEVYSGDAGQETVHCQGHAVFSHRPAPRRLDLAQLRQQICARTVSATDVYAICATMGLHYGPAHQGITALHVGDGELLADLQLPAGVERTEHEYVLHPSLMDSGLQASIGLIVDPQRVPSTPYVPFTVESARILSPCTRDMVAWVRYADGHEAREKTATLDIDLCDAHGNVCVELRGFSLRALDPDAKVALPAATHHRIPVKSNGGGTPEAPFDDAFYETLITDIANRKLSIDEALELS